MCLRMERYESGMSEQWVYKWLPDKYKPNLDTNIPQRRMEAISGNEEILAKEAEIKPFQCLRMERYERLYKAKDKVQNSNYPLIHMFLNKLVKVKIEGNFEVSGVLICYQTENKTLHKPSVLVLKDDGSYHFLRGAFESITEVK